MRQWLLAVTMAIVPFGAGAQTASMPEVAAQWVLTSINGQAVSYQAVLDLREAGRISGQGPCNRWFSQQNADLPDIALGPIGATRMACPDLADEAAMLDVLSTMTRAALSKDGTLVLTGGDGLLMEFTRQAE